MDGHIAPLPNICSLARKYNALVFVDDCHSTGFLGPRGRGTDEYWGIMGQVDIINTTLGKVAPPLCVPATTVVTAPSVGP